MSWILEYKQAAAYYSVGVITTLVAINVLYNATRYAKYHSASSEGWLQWLRRRLFGEEEKTTTDQTPNVLSSWVELIGNTPMVRINCLSQATGCEIYVRLVPCQNRTDFLPVRIETAYWFDREKWNMQIPVEVPRTVLQNKCCLTLRNRESSKKEDQYMKEPVEVQVLV
eukprot:gb/GECG01006418.1/.p1 GENE.gb/GECG01006418.1/~~gb/GECG01006418.1/.p1  ORF type:complete len:169 (+),score=16.69 gb/GECG01006418.1/:1-507(+)